MNKAWREWEALWMLIFAFVGLYLIYQRISEYYIILQEP